MPFTDFGCPCFVLCGVPSLAPAAHDMHSVYWIQLWHRKVWRRHFRHVCPSTWLDDEMCRSCYHGWYHCCGYSHQLLVSTTASISVRLYWLGMNLQIYGLVVAVLISGSCQSCLSLHHLCSYMHPPSTVDVYMSLAASFIYLGAGLSVGLAGLAAGFAIGIVGDAGVRGTAQQPRLFVGMVSVCYVFAGHS